MYLSYPRLRNTNNERCSCLLGHSLNGARCIFEMTMPSCLRPGSNKTFYHGRASRDRKPLHPLVCTSRVPIRPTKQARPPCVHWVLSRRSNFLCFSPPQPGLFISSACLTLGPVKPCDSKGLAFSLIGDLRRAPDNVDAWTLVAHGYVVNASPPWRRSSTDPIHFDTVL